MVDTIDKKRGFFMAVGASLTLLTAAYMYKKYFRNKEEETDKVPDFEQQLKDEGLTVKSAA